MSRKNLKDGLTLIVDELVLQGVSLQQARKEFERQFISASIRSNGGNLCRSARSLGVALETMKSNVEKVTIRRVGWPNGQCFIARTSAGPERVNDFETPAGRI